jgi:hypothetical protein
MSRTEVRLKQPEFTTRRNLSVLRQPRWTEWHDLVFLKPVQVFIKFPVEFKVQIFINPLSITCSLPHHRQRSTINMSRRPHPDAGHHYHSFRPSTQSCNCVSPPHVVNICIKCPRYECARQRERIESPPAHPPRNFPASPEPLPLQPRPSQPVKVSSGSSSIYSREQNPPNTKCIPETEVKSREELYQWGENGRSCRYCSKDFWCWCQFCGHRMCADCCLKECERTIEAGVMGERVRHGPPLGRGSGGGYLLEQRR